MSQAEVGIVGAGVIGLGIGEQHIAGYDLHPACEVVALCDISEDKLNSAARQYHRPERTTCWRDLVQDDRIQFISIASFDNAHFEQTMACIANGKHVFIEKPLVRTAGELRQVKAALSQREGVGLSSNLVLRAAPVYQWLRTAISEGLLGELYAVDGDYLYGRIHKITDGWRKDMGAYSVMLGGGIHMADLMLWVTGQRPTRVSARGADICTRHSSFDNNDFVAAVYEFESGMIGRITANFGCVHRHHHYLRVFGTKATFILDDQGPRLMTTRDPEAPVEIMDLPTLPAAKWDLIPGFVDQVLRGERLDELAQQEFDTMSVCLAADAALEANATLEIEYL